MKRLPVFLFLLSGIESCPFLQVTAIDELALPDGSRRRRIHFQAYFQGQNPDSLQWIEGIGSSWGFFNSYSNFFTHYLPVDPRVFVDLLCLEQNGSLLYTQPDLYEGSCYYPAGPFNSLKETNKEAAFRCFPNPAGAYLEVSWDGPLPSASALYQAIGIDGKVHLQVRREGERQRIRLHQLPPGWYALRLQADNYTYSVPFLKR